MLSASLSLPLLLLLLLELLRLPEKPSFLQLLLEVLPRDDDDDDDDDDDGVGEAAGGEYDG